MESMLIHTGVWQSYGQAKGVIVADHVHERTDGFVAIGVTEGTWRGLRLFVVPIEFGCFFFVRMAVL